MRSSGVHHVDLVVSSVERSLPFYRDLLGPLGFHRICEVEGERGETIWYFAGPGSSVGIRKAQGLGGIDRYRIGLHHRRVRGGLAGGRGRAPRLARRLGRGDRDAAARVRYMPGYYAVFFYDPDGIKLEIVHVAGLAA